MVSEAFHVEEGRLISGDPLIVCNRCDEIQPDSWVHYVYGARVVIESGAMDRRALIQDHLRQAERHVAQGREHVSGQTELAAKLEQDGHVADEAQRLLHQFKELLALHVSERDRLKAELAGCG